MSIAPVIAKTRIAANSATGRFARDEVVGAERDGHRDDRHEQDVEERRQVVDLVGATERGDRRRAAADDQRQDAP